jgi:glycerol-3-phosphate dehydrogenase
MAKAAADLVCRKLVINEPCATDTVLLRPLAKAAVLEDAMRWLPEAAVEKAHRRLGVRFSEVLDTIKANPALSEMACECELVTRAELEMVLGVSALVPARTIGDVGRRSRLGFGPCQGTFCGYKAMLAGYQSHRWSAGIASEQLEKYLDDRWKGQAWVPEGKQAEQLHLSEELYSTSYNFHKRAEVTNHGR